MLFVTGATGFLGRPLISRLLAEGVPVRCLCRPGAAGAVPPGTQAFEAALWDAGGLASGLRGCGTILHLAGKAHDLGLPDESEFRHVNVEGTRMLLQAAQQAEVRTFIFVSSVKAMGEGGDLCLDEDAPAVPRSSYGVSKLEAERLVLEMGSKAGMHVTVLRLPLVYGQGLKGNLRAMLDAVKRGKFPPPPRIRNRRSLVSTEDVVNAILLASGNRAASGRTYIVTDGTPYSSRDIFDAMRFALGLKPIQWAVPRWAFKGAALAGDAVARVTGRQMPFSSDAFEKLLGSACYHNDRIRRELGFTPATTLPSALSEIVGAGTRTK